MDPNFNTKGYKMTSLYIQGLQGIFVIVFVSDNQGDDNQDNNGNAAQSSNQNCQQKAERMDW